MLKDRNVRTRDNRRRSSRSELPPQTAKIVIDLRRLCRAKRESGSILENTPDLRVERFSAIDLTWVSWTKLCERMSLERS